MPSRHTIRRQLPGASGSRSEVDRNKSTVGFAPAADVARAFVEETAFESESTAVERPELETDGVDVPNAGRH